MEENELQTKCSEYLRNNGVCAWCIPRFLSPMQADTMLKDLSPAEGPPCSVCLGVLPVLASEGFSRSFSQFFEKEKLDLDNKAFDVDVAFPSAIAIRERSVVCALKEAFSDFPLPKEIFAMKKAAKVVSQRVPAPPGYCRAESGRGGFTVTVAFTHDGSDGDYLALNQMGASLRQRKRQKNDPLQQRVTWGDIAAPLARIADDLFRKHVRCPPEAGEKDAVFDFSYHHPAVFVAGRYQKLDRSVPQTKWIVEGRRKGDSSVEEIITPRIQSAFLADSLVFSSSGREDCDVRMLGRGRPFLFEVVNPRRTAGFGVDVMHKVQEEVNRDADDRVVVCDLQMVTREQTQVMKDAEVDKRKSYRALVWASHRLCKEDLERLSNVKDLLVEQKTPIRVLHRRTLAVRPRMIYSMNCEWINEHFFVLDLVTQAGTYIKEFAHGDLGRCRPSLASMLGGKGSADILQLDVTHVDLDFPPRLGDD